MNYPSTTGALLDADRENRLSNSRPYYLYQPPLLSRLQKLSRKKIWLSDPKNFNDPFDIRLNLENLNRRGPFNDEARLRDAMHALLKDNPEAPQHWFYNDHLLESVQKWINQSISSYMLEQAIQARFDEFGVSCFTPIWNHGLMWSHYADSHTGYCIEYCVKDLTLNLSNQRMFSSFHVEYTSKLPTVCISEALFSPHQTLSRMLATKSIEWSYEQEWRLVHLEKKATYVETPEGMEISALIVGLKAQPKLITKLLIKARALKVPLYRIKQVGYELKLELM